MSSKVQSELNHLKTSTGRILNFSKTRISSRNLLIILSLLTLTSNLSSVKSSADAHRRDDFSFRGPVPEDLHIPHWDISGTTHRIPTAKDFIRLVNPFPLAYGGMFTERTIPFDQWSVEIAFRIHGGYSTVHHGHRNTSHQDAVEDDEHLGKGGRGIAFWYTKSSNPTPVISPSNPHHHRFQPPSLVVDPFPDPLDEKVSFFGGPISFDGVAVVIDNQPSTPLTRRSDRKHWGHEDGGTGAEEWAVVSGVMDDGKGKSKWLEDRSFSEMDEDEEAAYLNHTIGDCQVALRNAPGMVWMKVTHIEGHLRVYLDLLPHTTLSGEERHYTRECFSANNVKLPKNYHIGLTGLSSPNEESDNIDVYAIEVKEIKGHVNKEEEIIEHYKEEHVAADDVKLEGTSKKSDHDAMATETMNSQKLWAEEVKRMSEKLASIGKEKLVPDKSTSVGGSDLSALDGLNRKLDTILDKIGHSSTGHSSFGSDSEIMKKLKEIEERTTNHERFLSEQIEQLRYLILYPQAAAAAAEQNYKHQDQTFKPLESLHDQPSSAIPPTGHYDHLNHPARRSMLNFLCWVVGLGAVFWIGYRYGIKQFTSKRSNRFDDNGDGIYNGNASGGYNPISTTMDAFGFRQRSKKMI